LNRLLRFLIVAGGAAVLAFATGALVAPSVFETPRFVSSIGAASQPVVVPDVIGMTRQDAQREVEEATLVLAGQWSEYGTFETMGLVIRQDPPPGALTPRGSSVSIFWNIGPLYRPFHPDSLIGLTAVEAEEKIADWQLYSIGRSWVPDPTVPEGSVIGVCPRQYDSLMVTVPVRLLVSTGWEGMPRLVGLTYVEAGAIAAMNDLVLTISEERVTSDVLQDGIVLEQLEEPGAASSPGDTIHVVVGRMDTEWGIW
jgi:eukaryotic-like serine/threonine-protein kinase